MRVLILIVIIGSLFSCSHEKKLSRAKRNLTNLIQEFPELIKNDTIFQIDTLRIEAKAINGEISLNKKYEKLDSLLALYSHDTTINKETITNTIKNYIINKPILLDTISVDTVGIHFRLFERSGKLAWSINIDEEELIKKYATLVNNVNAVKEIEKDLIWWQITLMVLGVLSTIFIILDLYTSFKNK